MFRDTIPQTDIEFHNQAFNGQIKWYDISKVNIRAQSWLFHCVDITHSGQVSV